MPNRRTFLSLLVVATVATGAAHAGALIVPTRESVATESRTAPTRVSWASILATYHTVMGMTLSQLSRLSEPLEILGVRDGPDGVDGLGAKGIKGLTPKYRNEEEGDLPPPSE